MASPKSPAERAAERIGAYLHPAAKDGDRAAFAAIIAEEYAPLVEALNHTLAVIGRIRLSVGFREDMNDEWLGPAFHEVEATIRAALGSEGGKR